MPDTVVGLLIFVAFLIPGFLYVIQRRTKIPGRKNVSPLVETATFLTISLLTDLVTAGLSAIVRWRLPTHTLDFGQLIVDGRSYLGPRLGYFVGWASILLVVSSALALLLAFGVPKFLGWLPAWLTPDIVQVSAWYHVMEDEALAGNGIFVGCDMSDGSYVSGFVEWFNTDVDEVVDRDIALASPITVKRDDKTDVMPFSRMIVSAKDIVRLYVSYSPIPEDVEAESSPESIV